MFNDVAEICFDDKYRNLLRLFIIREMSILRNRHIKSSSNLEDEIE